MKNVALLISGGLDSSVLAVELANNGTQVWPIYVRQDLHWEATEATYLARFLAELRFASIQPLVTLELPISAVYNKHWSVNGKNVPDQTTTDEAVYLPGRNLLLLSLVGTWCKINEIHELSLATLNENPFSDNTEAFYRSITDSINIALDSQLSITQPYRELHKSDVVRRGKDLPLHLTFSCIQPVHDLHCGVCNKCAERKNAFIASGISDTTDYQN